MAKKKEWVPPNYRIFIKINDEPEVLLSSFSPERQQEIKEQLGEVFMRNLGYRPVEETV